jgi:hypothetical protein
MYTKLGRTRVRKAMTMFATTWRQTMSQTGGRWVVAVHHLQSSPKYGVRHGCLALFSITFLTAV